MFVTALHRRKHHQPWWLAGDLNPTKAVIAYSPIDASSLGNSGINKANPGTYDAVLGEETKAYTPTWTLGVGWGFGIVDTLGRACSVPLDIGSLTDELVVLARCEVESYSDENAVFGSLGSSGYGDETSFWLIARSTNLLWSFPSDPTWGTRASVLSGVLGVARSNNNTLRQLWIDGELDNSVTMAYDAANSPASFAIGARHVESTDTYQRWLRGTVQAFFVGKDMTDAEITNISNAMAAL